MEFSCCLLWLPVLDPWHKNCKPCSYNSGSAHMHCLLSLRGFLQVRLVQMTAEPCQGSNKFNPLTTWCLATKCGNHPRTVPDLSLRLQRVFRGWLLQVEAYNSGSWLHTFFVQTIQLGDKCHRDWCVNCRLKWNDVFAWKQRLQQTPAFAMYWSFWIEK